MAINFPNTPTDQQEFTEDGQTWTWDATAGVWYVSDQDFPGDAADYLQLAGGTMTGDLEVPNVLVTGNLAVGGQLTLAADPTQPLQAASKSYVDSKAVTERTASDAKYVDVAGDTMTGNLTIGSTSITAAGLIEAGGNVVAKGGTMAIRSDATPSLAYQTVAGVTKATLNLSQSSGRIAIQTYGASTNTALQVAADAEAPVAFFWKAGVNTARVEGAGTDLTSAVSVVTREKGDARYLQIANSASMATAVGTTGGKVAIVNNDGFGHANLTFNHRSATPMQNGSSGRIEVDTDLTTAAMRIGLKDNVTLGATVDTTDLLILTTTQATLETPLHINGALTTYNRFSFTRTDGASYIDFDDATGNTAPLVFRNNVDGSVASIGLNDDTAVNAHTIITRRKGDARYAQLAAANVFTQAQTITQGGEGGQLVLTESASGKILNIDMIAAANMGRIFHNMDGGGNAAYEFPGNITTRGVNSVLRQRDGDLLYPRLDPTALAADEYDELVYRGGTWMAQPGALSGNRNRLLNALYRVDFQGRASGTSAHKVHIVDGWATSIANAVTTQAFSRVDGNRVPYSLKYAVTAGADAAPAAAAYTGIETGIEGYDVADAKWGTADAKPIWVCGRIKAPTTGVYCVSVVAPEGSRSYVFEVACVANTWVDFEHEVPGDTAGTWPKFNNLSLRLRFAIASGTTYGGATADTWMAGNYVATANQAIGTGAAGNEYLIEDVRLSVGAPVPTEWTSVADELRYCQRYFQVHTHRLRWDQAIAGETVGVIFPLPTSMRVTPSVGINQLSAVNMNSIAAYGVSAYSMQIDYGGGGAGGASDYRFNAECSARMY